MTTVPLKVEKNANQLRPSPLSAIAVLKQTELAYAVLHEWAQSTSSVLSERKTQPVLQKFLYSITWHAGQLGCTFPVLTPLPVIWQDHRFPQTLKISQAWEQICQALGSAMALWAHMWTERLSKVRSIHKHNNKTDHNSAERNTNCEEQIFHKAKCSSVFLLAENFLSSSTKIAAALD